MQGPLTYTLWLFGLELQPVRFLFKMPIILKNTTGILLFD